MKEHHHLSRQKSSVCIAAADYPLTLVQSDHCNHETLVLKKSFKININFEDLPQRIHEQCHLKEQTSPLNKFPCEDIGKVMFIYSMIQLKEGFVGTL